MLNVCSSKPEIDTQKFSAKGLEKLSVVEILQLVDPFLQRQAPYISNPQSIYLQLDSPLFLRMPLDIQMHSPLLDLGYDYLISISKSDSRFWEKPYKLKVRYAPLEDFKENCEFWLSHTEEMFVGSVCGSYTVKSQNFDNYLCELQAQLPELLVRFKLGDQKRLNPQLIPLLKYAIKQKPESIL